MPPASNEGTQQRVPHAAEVEPQENRQHDRPRRSREKHLRRRNARAKTAPRSSVEIDTTRSELSDLAAYLEEHVGQRVTAYLSGLRDSKRVGQWAEGTVRPRSPNGLRLRHGYHATRLLVEAFGDETAKAWLFGANRQLGDEAPAFVLRHSELPEEVAPVIRAARSFAETGRRPANGVDADAEETPTKPEMLAERLRDLERSQERLAAEIRELVKNLKGGMASSSGKGGR